MDDQPKPDPGSGKPVTPDPGSGPRDLSFLWPALDRIRAVEIKFHGDDSAPPNVDIDTRLKALEADVAAIRETLQEAIGATAGRGPAARASTGKAPELAPQSEARAALGFASAIVLLLVAHSLVVFVFDLPTLVLRLVSIAIPLPIAVWMTLHRRIRPWLEVSMALSIGLIAVGAMSFVVSVHEHASFLPETGREWRETLEFVASIAFAYGTGVLISGTAQARSGAPNRAGQVTLKLAQAVASVTGKAIKTGPEIKKHVDLIQALINFLALLVTGAMAIVTGLRAVIR
jgi:hypothetical protein